MAKNIIEYKMHRNEEGSLKIPYFVEDAGYFRIGGKFIGVSCNDSYVYLPTSVIILTNQGFIDRVVSMVLYDEFDIELTTTQKQQLANDWLTERGFI